MKVTDDEEKTVAVGQPGHLWIRSPYLFESYLNYKQNGSKALFHKSGGRGQGHWFNTDDLAIIDGEGTVEVIGRDSDTITRDDVKIYPHTYESMLRKFPKVNDVYVSGVPDEKVGEEISVCVSFQNGYWVSEDGLLSFFERKKIDPLPKYLLVVDQFPRLPNGKMDRTAMHALVLDKYKHQD
jgi:fatty-acyl-CoA synthase